MITIVINKKKDHCNRFNNELVHFENFAWKMKNYMDLSDLHNTDVDVVTLCLLLMMVVSGHSERSVWLLLLLSPMVSAHSGSEPGSGDWASIVWWSESDIVLMMTTVMMDSIQQ